MFAIGSCTKAFTASLLGLLNKDGKVDFDKTVRTYLPDVNFYNNDLNNSVTLRDMMSHRTSLPRHDLSWYFFTTSNRDSLVQRLQYLEPSAPLRQRWQYNNFMFMLQGVVAEKLTGKSWEENIKEKFFTPLSMTRSTVLFEDWMKTDDIAVGYTVRNDSLIDKMEYYKTCPLPPCDLYISAIKISTFTICSSKTSMVLIPWILYQPDLKWTMKARSANCRLTLKGR